MGLDPRQVDGMSLWEFVTCVDAWRLAQGGEEEPEAPSEEEYINLIAGT